MAVNWSEAGEVERVAEWLIPQFHAHLEQNGVEIRYRHRDDKPRSGDRDVLGNVVKIANLAAYEAGGADDGDGEPFFVLWVPEHVWELLDERGKVGLVDSLLCRMQSGRDDDGNVKISKRKPEFEGFYDNLTRFGMWQTEAVKMFEAMRAAGQLTLDLTECPLPKRPVLEMVAMGSLEPADLEGPGRLPLQVVEGGASEEEGAKERPAGRMNTGRRSLGEWQRGQREGEAPPPAAA